MMLQSAWQDIKEIRKRLPQVSVEGQRDIQQAGILM